MNKNTSVTILTVISFTLLLVSGLLFFWRRNFEGAIALVLSSIFFFILFEEKKHIQKNKFIIKKEEVPNEVVIGYSIPSIIFKISVYFLFVVLGFYLLFQINFAYGSNPIIFCLGIIFILGYSYKILSNIMKIKSKNSVIILSRYGIKIIPLKTFFNWDKILNERIIKKEVSADYKIKHLTSFLTFRYKGKSIEIDLHELEITENQLIQYLKIFRERKS